MRISLLFLSFFFLIISCSNDIPEMSEESQLFEDPFSEFVFSETDENNWMNNKVHFYKNEDNSEKKGCVLILPGGGYANHTLTIEGTYWIPFYRELGLHVLVLEYNLPNTNPAIPIKHVELILKKLHENADELGIDIKKIGIMGSSAGGHLSSFISNEINDSLKPSFQVLFYPVISMLDDLTHYDSRYYLLGDNISENRKKRYSTHLTVTSKTPPTFIAVGKKDKVVSHYNSILYSNALNDKEVKNKLLLIENGYHGYVVDWEEGSSVLESLKQWLSVFIK